MDALIHAKYTESSAHSQNDESEHIGICEDGKCF